MHYQVFFTYKRDAEDVSLSGTKQVRLPLGASREEAHKRLQAQLPHFIVQSVTSALELVSNGQLAPGKYQAVVWDKNRKRTWSFEFVVQEEERVFYHLLERKAPEASFKGGKIVNILRLS